MKEIMECMRRWDAAGLASAEAVLVSVQHSSPRPAGARLVVNEKGEMAGAVSMGCVESDLREHLLALIRGEEGARMIQYGASFSPSLEVGLTCGGEIKVWLRRHDPAAAGWQALIAMNANEQAVLLTRLGGESEQVVWRPGETPPVPEMSGPLEELLGRGGTGKIDTADGRWFAEVVEPDPKLLIVGASPIAAALCDFASRTGFRVFIIDPRRDFARSELFASAERVVHRWPGEGLAEAGMDARSYVAVLAHDAKLDVPALAAALGADCRYIGLLGSAHTREERYAALRSQGFEAQKVGRIRGPIGLKRLGGIEPAEIAVSILAELIMARRGKLEPAGAEGGGTW